MRAVFSGKLTYSADWDAKISPWQGQHGLPAGTGDLATQVASGVSSIIWTSTAIPRSRMPQSDACQSIAGWTSTPSDSTSLAVTGNQSLISYFASVATQAGKPLLFTEIGYESANDAAKQPFATSTNVYDPALQGNLYSAFFEAWQQSGNNTLVGVFSGTGIPTSRKSAPAMGPISARKDNLPRLLSLRI